MIYLLIQIILNILIVRNASDGFLRFYKKASYLMYTIITIVSIWVQKSTFNMEELVSSVKNDNTYGIAIDITEFKYLLVIFLAIIIIQFIFNTSKLIKMIKGLKINFK